MRIATIIAAASAVTLAGCAGAPASGFGPSPLTPTQRFTLQVEPGVERVALAVHETGPSANQQNALVDVANRFSLAGADVLRVESPSGQDAVANAMAWGIRDFLQQIGVPAARIQLVGYDAPDPRAPVLVGYQNLRAHVPVCNGGATNLTRTANNEVPANFGCAVTANLAAQIANPRDIIAPRAMTPSDAGRRSVVFDAYRKGDATAAQREMLLSGQQVSQAVQ